MDTISSIIVLGQRNVKSQFSAEFEEKYDQYDFCFRIAKIIIYKQQISSNIKSVI